MYDDGDKIKTYAPSGAGSLKWKFAGGPKAEYDKAQEGKKDAAPAEALYQRRANGRDSFDADPTTASMYDDGDKIKTYAPSGAGSLKWKFAGGPKAEYDKAQEGKKDAAPAEALYQRRANGRDSFDADPTTASMYDDGDKIKTYAPSGAGSLKWKFAGGPKAEYDKAQEGKKDAAPAEALYQRRANGRDSFDADPTTASMYDDGDKVKTYSPAGAGSLKWKYAGGPKAEYDTA
jgi:hypothetical protein